MPFIENILLNKAALFSLQIQVGQVHCFWKCKKKKKVVLLRDVGIIWWTNQDNKLSLAAILKRWSIM